MEILWWLLPPVLVTGLAMMWVSWAGREGAGEIDREAQAVRFAEAMRREHPGRTTRRPVRSRDRSTGIAVRPSRASEPASRRTA